MLRQSLQPLLRPLLRRIDEQASGGLVPSMSLNFLSDASLDTRVTFTRASSATRVNSSGLIETVASNAPRFDYNPVTLQPKGLLIEEQRTNIIRNNTMVGAAAGTPGTLPTNWSRPNQSSGLTLTTSYVTSYGVPCLRMRFFGTTAGTSGNETIEFETRTSISANSGQTWTSSFYYQLVSGAVPSGLSFNCRVLTFNSSNTLVDNLPILSPAPTATLQRALATVTSSAGVGTGGFITSSVHMSAWPTNTAVDFTLDLFMPQLEQGEFATSVIPTSGTAATRAADIATMTGTNFSSWYRQDEGTFFTDIQGTSIISGATRRGIEVNDGSVANRHIVGYNESGSRAITVVSNVFVTNLTVSAAIGSPLRIAYGYVASGSASTVNGSLPALGSPASIPSVNQMRLGADANTTIGTVLNGHIRRIAYYPRRLSNTELQAITS